MRTRPAPDEVYRRVTRIFATAIVGFGVAIVAVTLANGGGPGSVGLWIGLLFVALGAGRLYLALRARG
ncbi:MAG: hypothetical protein ACRDKX_03365 [Solirubrobacterales bacterium]